MERPVFILHRIDTVINITRLVTIHYFEFAKDFVFDGESHDIWEMVYVDKGEILETAGTQTVVLDFDKLSERVRERNAIDTPAIYERIWNGGMPALISGQYTDRCMVYSSYISTYIDRDVKEISGTVDSLKFMNFITAAAALAGQMLNYKTIADAAGIDLVSAKNWLGILERLGIIFYLHPYSNNMLKRMVTKPKLYFYDCGLVAYLTKWSDSDTLMNGAMSGAILENFAVSEISRAIRTAAWSRLFTTTATRTPRRLTSCWRTAAGSTQWRSRKPPCRISA